MKKKIITIMLLCFMSIISVSTTFAQDRDSDIIASHANTAIMATGTDMTVDTIAGAMTGTGIN